MAQDYFATAFVRVKADPAEFKRTLKATIEAAQNTVKPLKVPIVFVPTAFKKSIQDVIRAAGPFKAKIEPDTSGFQKKLQTQLKGIKIPVQVIPVAGPEVRQAIKSIQASAVGGIAAAAAAPPVIPASFVRGAVPLPTPTVLLPPPPAGRQTGSGAGGGLARLTIEEKALQQVESTRRTLLEGVTRAQTQYDAAIKAELEPTAALEQLTVALNTAEKAHLAIITQGALEEQNLAKARVRGLVGITNQSAELKAKVKQTKDDVVATIANTAAQATYQKLIAEAAVIQAADISQIKTKSGLRSFEARRLAVVNGLQQQVAIGAGRAAQAAQGVAGALTEEAAAYDKDAAAILKNVLARGADVQAQRKTISSATNNARRTSQVTRGGEATGLSLLGIRGATLAASSAFLVGAAAVTVFAKAVKSASGLQTELNVFQVTAGATADQMKRVREQAIALGDDLTLPSVSASDAATAMTELAKAGLSVQDSIDGARGVLELATAAAIDNAAATQIVASALNAFGLSGRDAVKVADVLANAADAAQGSIADMGLALAQSAAVGRQVGLSIADTTSFLTTLARAGLRGSDAGTSLRTALIRIINPSKAATAIFEKLGITVRDAEGHLKPDFFVNLGIAIQGMGKRQRDATLALIGGQDAVRALSILTRQNIGDLIKQRDTINTSGKALLDSAARTKGLAGASESLKNTLETLGVQLGGNVTTGLSNFVNTLNRGVQSLTSSQSLKSALGTIGAALHNFSAAIGSVASGLTHLEFVPKALASVFGAVGATPIFTAIASFKLLSGVMDSFNAKSAETGKRTGALGRAFQSASGFALLFRGAAREVGTTIKEAGVAAGGFRAVAAGAAAGLGAMASGALAFATSLPGIIAGVALLAGGLIFLLTRESAATHAAKELKNALDALSSTTDKNADAQRRNVQATADLRAARDQVTAAAIASNAADKAAAAAPASGRVQAINDAKIAFDNLRQAVLTEQQAEADARTASVAASQAKIDLDKARGQSIKDLNQELAAQQDKAAQFTGGGGVQLDQIQLALNLERAHKDFIKTLQKEAQQQDHNNTDASHAVAARIREVINFAKQVKGLPNKQQIDILFNFAKSPREVAQELADSIGRGGGAAGKAFVDSLANGISLAGTAAKGPADDLLNQIKAQFGNAGNDAGLSFLQSFIAALASGDPSKILGALLGNLAKPQPQGSKLNLADAGALAAATGASQGDQLAAAQKRADNDRRVLAQLVHLNQNATDAQIRAAGESGKFSKKRRDAINKAASDLAQDKSTIAGIQQGQASAAEASQQKAQAAQQKADQAIISSIGVKEQGLLNKLLRAQQTKRLSDDITREKELVRFYRREINIVRRTVKNGQTQDDEVRALQQKILQIRVVDLPRDRAAQKKAIADAKTAANAVREQKIQLDIQFAQTTGNKSLEIRLHERLIAALKQDERNLIKEKGQHAKNTIAYKELRNQIAVEEKAISDLKAQNDAKTDATRALFFSFLQSQQGFASNLFSNLIPGFARGGLVGGGNGPNIPGSPAPVTGPGFGGGLLKPQPTLSGTQILSEGARPGDALARAASSNIAAGNPGGATTGQAATMIKLLGDLVIAVRGLSRGTEHPEARTQRKRGATVGDDWWN